MSKQNNTRSSNGILYSIKKFLTIYALVVIAIVATLHLHDWINIIANNRILIIPDNVFNAGEILVNYGFVRPIESIIQIEVINNNNNSDMFNMFSFFGWLLFLGLLLLVLLTNRKRNSKER